MATVTTPTGERLEGVEGSLLDYYRGEANTVPGYVIDDGDVAVTDTPRLMDGDTVIPLTDQPDSESVDAGSAGDATSPSDASHGVDGKDDEADDSASDTSLDLDQDTAKS